MRGARRTAAQAGGSEESRSEADMSEDEPGQRPGGERVAAEAGDARTRDGTKRFNNDASAGGTRAFGALRRSVGGSGRLGSRRRSAWIRTSPGWRREICCIAIKRRQTVPGAGWRFFRHSKARVRSSHGPVLNASARHGAWPGRGNPRRCWLAGGSDRFRQVRRSAHEDMTDAHDAAARTAPKSDPGHGNCAGIGRPPHARAGGRRCRGRRSPVPTASPAQPRPRRARNGEAEAQRRPHE